MNNNLTCLLVVLCFTRLTWAFEDPKYIDYVNSSAIKTEALVQEQSVLNPNQTAPSLGWMYKDFSDLHLGLPVYAFTWRVYQPERNIAWNLHIFNSFSEAKMKDGYYYQLSSSTVTAIFNSLSLLGLGGGFRGRISEDLFWDLGADLVYFNNAQTRSGFNGLSLAQVCQKDQKVRLNTRLCITTS